jgi:TPP-dependent indolepyruvate ferredoxin oxidoreductase alpha subunit
MSQEAKDRISKANTGRLMGSTNHAARTIIFQGETYSTLLEAIEKTGLSKYLLKKNGALFI